MIASAHAAGRSPISRCPQSAITRSGALQPPGVLERIPYRQLVVPRAPQHERGKATVIEVGPHVVADERLRGADRVGMSGGAGEERLDHLGRERGRVGGAPTAEDEPLEQGERATRRRCGAILRPGLRIPVIVSA